MIFYFKRMKLFYMSLFEILSKKSEKRIVNKDIKIDG